MVLSFLSSPRVVSLPILLVLGSLLRISSLPALEGPAHRVPSSPSATRGREVLRDVSLVPGTWTRSAYESLWKLWGLETRPEDLDLRVRRRYGLHPAPHDNGGLPLGLRVAPPQLEWEDGRRTPTPPGNLVAVDCLLCHAGTIAGRTIIGLGNSSLDLQTLQDELWAASGVPVGLLPPLSHQRGTVEAASTIQFLLQFRDSRLDLSPPRIAEKIPPLIEDIPAWWHLRKKKTLLHTGAIDARAVRPFLTFMLSPRISGDDIRRSEAEIADILAHVQTIEAPPYPFPIDSTLAARGQSIFEKSCSRCHGTYGESSEYPNRFVDLDEIGTDPVLAREALRDGPGKRHYESTWFSGETWKDSPTPRPDRAGYQAPPLDGIWATAPYFHNGSVPTLHHVLESSSRPRIWTRSFRTGEDEYDGQRVGWKVEVLPEAPVANREIYDTRQTGRGNSGHEFGDELDASGRAALIEYLKTL